MLTVSADMRVGNLMTLDPIVITPEATASEAERLIKTYRVSGLPVVENGEVMGVISQSDVMAARSSEMIAGHWDRLRVRHLMSTPAVSVHATAALAYAARQMVTRHIHRLVVIADDGSPIGVVTSLDLVRSLVDDPDVSPALWLGQNGRDAGAEVEQMSERMRGKVAIVTGGARGIGRASVRALVEEGAAVVLTDVLDEEGEALARELCAEGADVRYAHLDVSSEEQWRAVVERTVLDLAHVDVLVNNAGIGTMEDIEKETREGWDRLIAINQTGVWLGMKAVIPRMKANGGGSIVNLSSIFGAVGGFGSSIAYHASKGAVRLMSKNAAIRYAKEGIRVNSVHPGFIDTPMLAAVKGTPFEQTMVDGTPMGRLGRPEEIGGVVAFLASDAASYMTGSEVYVDGGWTAQ